MRRSNDWIFVIFALISCCCPLGCIKRPLPPAKWNISRFFTTLEPLVPANLQTPERLIKIPPCRLSARSGPSHVAQGSLLLADGLKATCNITEALTIYSCGHSKTQPTNNGFGQPGSAECEAEKARNPVTMGSNRVKQKCSPSHTGK